jgi:phage terminase large subunit-like protein
MAKEEMIRDAMRAVGTYNEIFEPSIKQLAKAERQLSRSEKEWRKQGGKMVADLVNKTGGQYKAKDPYWAGVEQQRKDVTALRNQLGLTPTGLNKVRNRQASADIGKSRIEQLLDDAHDYALDHAAEYQAEVDNYVDSVLSGQMNVCDEIRQACERYVSNLDTGQWDFRPDPACEIIAIIETMMCHQQGEFLDATPLRGTPFLLLPYHKFIAFNVMGFYIKGTNERRFKEGLVFVPRKNIKTTFAAVLAWAIALYERFSGSKVYEVGGALKQAREGFDFLKYNVKRQKISVDDDAMNGLRIIDNNMERSISGDVGDGFISINALASSPDKQDSFNCNVVIADELHTYKSPKQYQVLKDATKAYTNKLVLGISSGGDKAAGFCAQHVAYCKKILDGTIKGPAADSIFVFIAKAPDSVLDDGSYTDPKVLEACSPGWGNSIRPQDMLNDAQRAHDDPQLRPEFFNKSLNVFTAALRAYFDIEEFRRSDAKCGELLGLTGMPAAEIIKALARLPVQWYGGSDLSKLHDLTTGCLLGNYKGIDIIIPHCWFPRAAAAAKAEEDQIPLFGWQDDGWLDMCNDKVTNHSDVVKWYKARRAGGFKIRRIGHDRKFCREYFIEMKKAKFPIKDQPQLVTRKSEGFRYLEASAKRGTLYYCSAEPYEYCVQNVHAIEKADDMIMYDKIAPNLRIDVFDCSVFAACAYLEDLEGRSKGAGWYGKDEEGDNA